MAPSETYPKKKSEPKKCRTKLSSGKKWRSVVDVGIIAIWLRLLWAAAEDGFGGGDTATFVRMSRPKKACPREARNENDEEVPAH